LESKGKNYQRKSKKILLFLLISLTLLAHLGGKVLCLSPSSGHASIEMEHAASLSIKNTLVSFNAVFSPEGGHFNCIDIPLKDNSAVFAMKSLWGGDPLTADGSILYNWILTQYSMQIEVLRNWRLFNLAANLPTSGPHFLYLLISTVVILH